MNTHYTWADDAGRITVEVVSHDLRFRRSAVEVREANSQASLF